MIKHDHDNKSIEIHQYSLLTLSAHVSIVWNSSRASVCTRPMQPHSIQQSLWSHGHSDSHALRPIIHKYTQNNHHQMIKPNEWPQQSSEWERCVVENMRCAGWSMVQYSAYLVTTYLAADAAVYPVGVQCEQLVNLNHGIALTLLHSMYVPTACDVLHILPFTRHGLWACVR